MADTITIDTKGFTKGSKQWEALMNRFPDRVDDVLNKSVFSIEKVAKVKAPANNGQLRQNISADVSKPLVKSVSVNVPYAAYIEFGTGKYAAQQVANYPPEYKAYAAQFKGKVGGSFKDMIRLLTEWVKRKGITGTYSVKTNRRTGNKATQQMQNQQAAYAIAISILRNGVHPHPFLIPAVIDEKKHLIDNMKLMLNKLGVS